MVNPFLPEELIAQVMWHLRSSIGPARGLEYVWPKRNDERCVLGPYSDPAALVIKKERDNSKACRRTLASFMQASRGLCRLARAVYYATIEADQLSTFMQICIREPKLADRTDEDMFPASQWRNHNWIEPVTHLPKIDSIEVFDGSLPEGIEKSLLSSLKYLTVTSLPFACDEENIRCILGICPFLESLDLTTRPEVLRDEESSSWSAIDEVSSRNGANLRKFRFDNLSHPSAPGLLDVSSLRKLRYLAVPVDALVALYECYDTFGPAFYQHKVFTGNRHGCGSVHDIEDMWAEIILDKRDTALRYGSEIAGEDDEEEEVTRLMLDTGPNVPFFHLLPDNLQHLRLLDDADTVDIATYADGKLRDLVSHPGSSELGDVQVRRRAFFTEHVRNIGWHVERRPFWNVMRRV